MKWKSSWEFSWIKIDWWHEKIWVRNLNKCLLNRDSAFEFFFRNFWNGDEKRHLEEHLNFPFISWRFLEHDFRFVNDKIISKIALQRGESERNYNLHFKFFILFVFRAFSLFSCSFNFEVNNPISVRFSLSFKSYAPRFFHPQKVRSVLEMLLLDCKCSRNEISETFSLWLIGRFVVHSFLAYFSLYITAHWNNFHVFPSQNYTYFFQLSDSNFLRRLFFLRWLRAWIGQRGNWFLADVKHGLLCSACPQLK